MLFNSEFTYPKDIPVHHDIYNQDETNCNVEFIIDTYYTAQDIINNIPEYYLALNSNIIMHLGIYQICAIQIERWRSFIASGCLSYNLPIGLGNIRGYSLKSYSSARAIYDLIYAEEDNETEELKNAHSTII